VLDEELELELLELEELLLVLVLLEDEELDWRIFFAFISRMCLRLSLMRLSNFSIFFSIFCLKLFFFSSIFSIFRSIFFSIIPRRHTPFSTPVLSLHAATRACALASWRRDSVDFLLFSRESWSMQAAFSKPFLSEHGFLEEADDEEEEETDEDVLDTDDEDDVELEDETDDSELEDELVDWANTGDALSANDALINKETDFRI
jgi:hypothetical protein